MQISPVRLSPLALAAAQNNLINGKLVESHAGNAATFAVKTLAGSDPSISDPVMVIFPDASIITITAALSLVIPSGASIGSSTLPLRLWILLANDAGTPRFVVVRANTGNRISGLDPRGVVSATAPIASTACTYYSSVAFTNRPYRVIAYVDYDGGIPTAGNWTVSPTRIIMASESTPLPGSVIQQNLAVGSQNSVNSGAPQPTSTYVYITPYSAMNAVEVRFDSDFLLVCSSQSEYGRCQVYRNDAVAIGNMTMSYGWAATVVFGGSLTGEALDFPFTTAQTLYRLFMWIIVDGSNRFYLPHSGSSISAREIMA
jgi:hypothetical protein